MINNITNVDTQMPMSVMKTATSHASIQIPPILAFKTPLLKEKAELRVKKFRRGENIIVTGEIDDDYVDIVEDEIEKEVPQSDNFFISPIKIKRKLKYLKNCYVIDYIQSPKTHCGLGTEAIKGLAEKAMFDTRADGRIVTYSSPVWKESSPALFFYKLGFRFVDPAGNEYMQECIKNKTLDIPPQTGMMYLPKNNLHKLLRYGELF